MRKMIYKFLLWVASVNEDQNKKPQPSDPAEEQQIRESPVRRWELNDARKDTYELMRKINALSTFLGVKFETQGLTARALTKEEKEMATKFPSRVQEISGISGSADKLSYER